MARHQKIPYKFQNKKLSQKKTQIGKTTHKAHVNSVFSCSLAVLFFPKHGSAIVPANLQSVNYNTEQQVKHLLNVSLYESLFFFFELFKI